MSLGNWRYHVIERVELHVVHAGQLRGSKWSNTGTSMSGSLAELDIEVACDKAHLDLPHQNDGIPFLASLKGI